MIMGRAPGRGLGVDSVPFPGALVSLYLPVVDSASSVLADPLAEAAGPPAGMVAFRAADLQVRPGRLSAGRQGAVLVASAGTAGAAVAAGTMMTFCHPVVTAPAVIKGGAVMAGGWLPDHVRLGELERHLGEGVIEDLVAAGIAAGRMPAPQRRRLMSLALTIRMTVAMALMPEASYAGAIRRLAGLLAGAPWAREWHIPTAKVVTGWRGKVPPAVMEELFWLAAGPLVPAGDGNGDDDDPVLALAGMPVCGIDGMLVALADTPANRAMFGCTGTRNQKGPGSAPFPQLLAVVITARAGRARPGAICGRARAGEQTLLRHEVARDE